MTPRQELSQLFVLLRTWTKAVESGSDAWEDHWRAFDDARTDFVQKYLDKVEKV